MNTLLRFLFLPALLLLLVGCGQEVAETAVSPTTAPSPTVAPTAPSRDPYNPDPTLIANTGRPQFVTAYADW